MKVLNISYKSWDLIKWLWQTGKSFRLQAAINMLLGCCSVLLDFAFIWATKMAIDVATQKQEGTLGEAAFWLISIMAAQVGVGLTHRWTKAIFGVRAQNTMQQSVFGKLLGSEWNALQARHTGDLLNRLEMDVASVVQVLTETLPSVATVGIRLVGAFLFLHTMDAFLAWAVVLILPLFILLSKVYVGKMRRLTRNIRNTDSRIQSILQEALQHKMVIKTLDKSAFMAKRLALLQTELRSQVKQRTIFSAFSGTMLNIGFGGCYLIAFLWGSNRLLEGTISYGMMMAFIQLVGQIQSPFREMTRFVPVLVGSLTAAERLLELEELPKEEQGESIMLQEVPGVAAENICFRYPDGHRIVLQDFSYQFAPGSRTAIVGETGAGKTTLIRLILGLVHPDKGRIILFNDTQEVACSPRTRCNIVYVPQGNTLFSGTIRDNLLLGKPSASDEELKEVLHTACAEFVFDLPLGWETPCNEMGGGLSEGQAQRIAIARALLRPGRILLLDEATSALDAATEKQLLVNLEQRAHNRTLLFITHRPEVLAHCTNVLELKRHKT